MFLMRIMCALDTFSKPTERREAMKVIKEGDPVVMGWLGEKFSCSNCGAVFQLEADDFEKVSTKIYKNAYDGSPICSEHGSFEHFAGNPKCAHHITKCHYCHLEVEVSKVLEKQSATT